MYSQNNNNNAGYFHDPTNDMIQGAAIGAAATSGLVVLLYYAFMAVFGILFIAFWLVTWPFRRLAR